MIRKLLSAGAVAALLAVSPASAAVTVITYLDATSGSHNGAYALDGSSNAYPLSVLCGATTTTLGATVADCAIINASGQLLTLDTQSGTWNITNISGTISLPTGAATSALQTTGNTALTTINTTLGSPIQTTGGTVGLVAGSAIVGKVGIDQTTPGTTNGVVVNNTLTALVNNADGVTPISSVTSTAGNSPVNSTNFVYNGTTYDRQRGSAVNTGVAIVNMPSPYPDGAVPITASATGTTTATTATLTNVSGHTTYICGYSIRANATAAATVTDTITGVKTATLSSILWVSPLASGIGVDDGAFIPCIPASAVSTSIAVVSGAPGSGGTVSVRAWGYSL